MGKMGETSGCYMKMINPALTADPSLLLQLLSRVWIKHIQDDRLGWQKQCCSVHKSSQTSLKEIERLRRWTERDEILLWPWRCFIMNLSPFISVQSKKNKKVSGSAVFLISVVELLLYFLNDRCCCRMSFHCRTRLDPLANITESCSQTVIDRSWRGKPARSLFFTWSLIFHLHRFLWKKSPKWHLFYLAFCSRANVNMHFEIVLFHHSFGSAGSGSAVADAIWQLWCWSICNANPVAFFFLTHTKVRTHTNKSSVCCWVIWQNPPRTHIYWVTLVYVLVMICHSFWGQRKKAEKWLWKCEKKGGGQRWIGATLTAQCLWRVFLLVDNQLSLNTLLWYILFVISWHFLVAPAGLARQNRNPFTCHVKF